MIETFLFPLLPVLLALAFLAGWPRLGLGLWGL